MATVRQMVKNSRGMCARAMRAEGIKVHAPSFQSRFCAPCATSSRWLDVHDKGEDAHGVQNISDFTRTSPQICGK